MDMQALQEGQRIGSTVVTYGCVVEHSYRAQCLYAMPGDIVADAVLGPTE